MRSQAGRPGDRVVAIIVIVAVLLVGLAYGAYSLSRPSGPSGASNSTLSSGTAVPSTQSSSESVSSSSNANATVTQSPSNSTTQSSAGLNVTYMYTDVNGPGEQSLIQNYSTAFDKNAFQGHPGETFLVLMDIIYQDCSFGCPTNLTSVTTSTPGFKILGTSPSLPVGFLQCDPVCTDGDPSVLAEEGLEAQLTVSVLAPPTPYSGTFTLVASTA